MAKLQDMLTQARRGRGGGGMGFLGKNKAEIKARATALIVSFSEVSAGSAEAALKAGANGLLFQWDGQNDAELSTIQKEIESARSISNDLVAGLQINGGWDTLDREQLTNLKDQGIQYIVLPFNAPARLLAQETRDVEKVVVVPMNQGEIYPLYIRNLSAFDTISGVVLDFKLKDPASMSIEDVLGYRAVREAIRFPAFITINENLQEAEAYTLLALGIQALILPAQSTEEGTRAQIKATSALLEKIFQEEKDHEQPPSIPTPGRRS